MKRFFEVFKTVLRKRISALILSFIFLDIVVFILGMAELSNLLITLVLAAIYYIFVVACVLIAEKRGC